MIKLFHGKRPKYKNIKIEVDGIKFDSKKEARRYQELKLLESAGKITRINVHPRFKIIVNDEKICTYVADFEYWTRVLDGSKVPEYVVEDVKGIRTQAFILKKKLMFACYGIEVREV